MDLADRNYITALIDRAEATTRNARDVASAFGLVVVAEKLGFALDFQHQSHETFLLAVPNADGTTGPEHVTSEGRELGPPKG